MSDFITVLQVGADGSLDPEGGQHIIINKDIIRFIRPVTLDWELGEDDDAQPLENLKNGHQFVAVACEVMVTDYVEASDDEDDAVYPTESVLLVAHEIGDVAGLLEATEVEEHKPPWVND